jgi:hypothetical protein
MKSEDKLPKTFEWKFLDGHTETVTREEMVDGFKIGATGLRELMRDKGYKK